MSAVERIAARVSVGVCLVIGAYIAVELWGGLDNHRHGSLSDYILYRDAAAHWLATGRFYDYGFWAVGAWGPPYWSPVLYPPVILYLLVPFTVLPAPLWWAIPASVTGWTIARLRPARWTWPLMALAFVYPRTAGMIWFGNPGMWIVMFVALGCLYRWPGALILLKPSLAPFALIGIRSRGWWLVLGLLGLLSLPMLGLWADYMATLAQWHLSPIYSLPDAVPTAIPVLAALGRDGKPLRWPSWREGILSSANRPVLSVAGQTVDGLERAAGTDKELARGTQTGPPVSKAETPAERETASHASAFDASDAGTAPGP